MSSHKWNISEMQVKGKLTSLICKALILAWTTSGESVMLVNFISSGRVRYNLSFRSSWAFFAFTTSTEPSVNQPMPRSHSRSDLYTFYKETKVYWHCRDNSTCREILYKVFPNFLLMQLHSKQALKWWCPSHTQLNPRFAQQGKYWSFKDTCYIHISGIICK